MSAEPVAKDPRGYEHYLIDSVEILAAMEAIPSGRIVEFYKRFIGAYNDARRGDPDPIGLLLAGIVVEKRLSTNPGFLAAVEASEEEERQLQSRPVPQDLEKVLESLRA
jgi:hypothetical protein